MEGEWVFSWQSAERFAPYLTAEDRNLGINKALVLYEWNINASLSLLRDIAHFEIALRNHYDATFQRYWNGDRHWLLSDDSPVRTPLIRTRKKIDGNKKLKIKSDVNFKNRKSIEIAIKKNWTKPGNTRKDYCRTHIWVLGLTHCRHTQRYSLDPLSPPCLSSRY